MQITKSKKKNVKGYACAPSVLAGAAAMGVMVVALFVVLCCGITNFLQNL